MNTDGGYDDDTDDDADIYLNWRDTTYLNGENPNQQWYVYIEGSSAESVGVVWGNQLRGFPQAPSLGFFPLTGWSARGGARRTPVAGGGPGCVTAAARQHGGEGCR
ncbi:MAG: hypothetical protein ABIG44_11715, partial [Planctomycetota bacterium]